MKGRYLPLILCLIAVLYIQPSSQEGIYETQLPNCLVSQYFTGVQTCLRCSRGFSYDQKGKVCVDAAQLIPNCSVLQGDLCVQCNCGYVLNWDNKSCITKSDLQKIPNCGIYSDPEFQKCLKCFSGQYGDYGWSNAVHTQCIDNTGQIYKCAEYQKDVGNRLSCVSCHSGSMIQSNGACEVFSITIPNCRYMITDADQVVRCSQCLENYVQSLDQSACYKALPGCKIQKSDIICIECTDPLQGVDSTGLCVDLIQGCSQMSDQIQCLTCESGRALSEDGLYCYTLILGCAVPLSDTQCLQCLNEYGTNEEKICITNNPLENGTPNCNYYKVITQTNLECESCIQGFLISLPDKKCIELPKNCQFTFVNSALHCEVCDQPEIYGLSPFFQCVQKIENCRIPRGAFSCLECEDGYGLMYDETCRLNIRNTFDLAGIPGCFKYIDNGVTCGECIKGCLLTASNQCECDLRCTRFDIAGKICLKCIFGYLPDENGLCTKVNAATFIKWNGLCTKVMSSSVFGGEASQCYECIEGYAPNGKIDIDSSSFEVTITPLNEVCFRVSKRCSNQLQNFLNCQQKMYDSHCLLTQQDERCIQCIQSTDDYGLIQVIDPFGQSQTQMCVKNILLNKLIPQCEYYFKVTIKNTLKPLVLVDQEIFCRKCFDFHFGLKFPIDAVTLGQKYIDKDRYQPDDQQNICSEYFVPRSIDVGAPSTKGILNCEIFKSSTQCLFCKDTYVLSKSSTGTIGQYCVHVGTSLGQCQYGDIDTNTPDQSAKADLCVECKISYYDNFALDPIVQKCQLNQVRFCSVYQDDLGALISPEISKCAECYNEQLGAFILVPAAPALGEDQYCQPSIDNCNYVDYDDQTQKVYCLECFETPVLYTPTQDKSQCLIAPINCLYAAAESKCAECVPPFVLSEIAECILPLPNCDITINQKKVGSALYIRVCKKCTQGYTMTNEGKCTVGIIENCYSVKDVQNRAFCLECQTSFVISTDGLACVRSILNCDKVTSQGQCLECSPFYFPSSSKANCFNNISNCQLYSSDGKNCIECKPGFLTNIAQIGCFNSISNCQLYQSAVLCARCQNGFQVDFVTGICKRISNGCQKFVESEQKCIECEEGSQLDEEQVQCFVSIPNCLVIGNNGNCQDCALGYAVSENGNQCLEATQNCKVVAQQKLCLVCKIGYGVFNGKCVNFIPFCQIYEEKLVPSAGVQDGYICQTCEDSFVKNLKATICVQSQDSCSIQGCIQYQDYVSNKIECSEMEISSNSSNSSNSTSQNSTSNGTTTGNSTTPIVKQDQVSGPILLFFFFKLIILTLFL